MYARVIRYRWLPGHAEEGPRLARALVASAEGRPDLVATRVLRAIDGSNQGQVVFEWATREALDAHRTAASIEQVAPWAVPLLHWRTDQCYEREPVPPATASAGA